MTTQPTSARPAPKDDYVLGTDDLEVARLGLQHDLWSGYAISLWERSGLRPGLEVLDVGCGPGFATLDLAVFVGPTGRITGVDQSARYLQRVGAEAQRRGLANIETRLADVQRLEADAGIKAQSFDMAYARWVMCFLPDPEAVVAGVARALRPGGVFMVQDYFNYERATALAPFSPAFARVLEATGKSWRLRGGDPDIAGRIPSMMERHGLQVREINPIVRVARPNSLLWQWPESFWCIFTPKLVEMGLLTTAESDAFLETWREHSNNPAAFFSSPPLYDIVGVKK